jgi:hypothetical protein
MHGKTKQNWTSMESWCVGKILTLASLRTQPLPWNDPTFSSCLKCLGPPSSALSRTPGNFPKVIEGFGSWKLEQQCCIVERVPKKNKEEYISWRREEQVLKIQGTATSLRANKLVLVTWTGSVREKAVSWVQDWIGHALTGGPPESSEANRLLGSRAWAYTSDGVCPKWKSSRTPWWYTPYIHTYLHSNLVTFPQIFFLFLFPLRPTQ